MKSLIKKYFMAIVAVMMVVGFSAFKVIETNKKDSVIPESGWYSLHLTTSNPLEFDDQSKQQILSWNEDEPDGENCSPFENEEPCQVYLLFEENYDGPASIENVNMTIETLLLEPGVSISGTLAGNIDGYARKNE